MSSWFFFVHELLQVSKSTFVKIKGLFCRAVLAVFELEDISKPFDGVNMVCILKIETYFNI